MGRRMNVFDREQQRRILHADHGVARMLGPSLEESRARRALTSWGVSCFDTMVEAALCELDQEAGLLLERAESWLDLAVRENERSRWDFGKLWTEAIRFRVLGICRWLARRDPALDLFSSACDALSRYFKREKDKSEVAYNLPPFLLAQRYEELLARFSACKGLEPPASLKGIKCPGKMSYLFARHELFGAPDRSSLEGAFRSFLKNEIPVCLMLRSSGLGVPAHIPTWTLLDERYFDGATTSACENIRRALRYVPMQSSELPPGQPAKGVLAAAAKPARPPRSRWPRPSTAFDLAVKKPADPALRPWPRPIELARVVVEPGLLRFLTEILALQEPSAPVGAITLRPCRPERAKKVRALVYVGPLEWQTPQQIYELVQPTYSAASAWQLDRLLKFNTATLDEPLDY